MEEILKSITVSYVSKHVYQGVESKFYIIKDEDNTLKDFSNQEIVKIFRKKQGIVDGMVYCLHVGKGTYRCSYVNEVLYNFIQ